MPIFYNFLFALNLRKRINIITEIAVEFKKELEGLLKQGFQRVKIDGEVYDLEEVPSLEKNTMQKKEITDKYHC